MMMMMDICPRTGSLAFMPHEDEMSEVVSRCLPHRQLWVSNLSKVATQWLEVDSNPRPFGCKAQNIPLHHRVMRLRLRLLQLEAIFVCMVTQWWVGLLAEAAPAQSCDYR